MSGIAYLIVAALVLWLLGPLLRRMWSAGMRWLSGRPEKPKAGEVLRLEPGPDEEEPVRILHEESRNGYVATVHGRKAYSGHGISWRWVDTGGHLPLGLQDRLEALVQRDDMRRRGIRP